MSRYGASGLAPRKEDTANMHQIIRANRISAVVGLSRRHIERLANEGSFPKKLRIGPNSSG
jgi:predicted DNA-binding transcriptional regulator AlpA